MLLKQMLIKAHASLLYTKCLCKVISPITHCVWFLLGGWGGTAESFHVLPSRTSKIGQETDSRTVNLLYMKSLSRFSRFLTP